MQETALNQFIGSYTIIINVNFVLLRIKIRR